MKQIFRIILLILFLAGILTGCGFQVPRPEIKEGKFHFSVTYSLNGEEKTVSGIYVCTYDGVDWALDGGYHRVWSGTIEGGSADDCYTIGTTEDGGAVILSLHLDPDYFMGEVVTGGIDVPAPDLMVKYPEDALGGIEIIREAEAIEEVYGAKIISFQYDDPIENSFGLFK